MDGLVVGLDLNDDYTQICCHNKEKSWTTPMVVCRRKEEEAWLSGEEAYAATLLGEGAIVDKLLKMTARDGTSTTGGICYGGGMLPKLFIGRMSGHPRKEFGTDEVAQLVIAPQSVDCRLLDIFMYCVDHLGIPRDRVHVIGHTEDFIYYVLSQKERLWINRVGLFELSGERLCYHEMKVQRGMWRNMVQVGAQNQEEVFNLDTLDSSSDSRLADKILTACGEKLLNRKLFSMVFLTGKEFERQDWAGGSMRLVCNRRKVFVEPCFFARGAAFKGADYTHQETSYPYIFTREERLKAEVPLKVMRRGRENQLVVASYGDNWYESKSSMDLITDGQEETEFIISPLDSKKKKLVRILLARFPERPPKTTRIELKVVSTDGGIMTMSIRDRGLGELFLPSGAVVRQEVNLRT